MGKIVIRRPGYDIEVMDEADLRMVLRVLEGWQLQLPLEDTARWIPLATQPSTPKRPASEEAETLITVVGFEEAKRIWNSIENEKVREFLRALAHSPGPLTDSEVRDRLHLKDNTQIAGRTTAIIRNIKKAGVDPDVVFIRQKHGEIGNRWYTYDLIEAMKQAINVNGVVISMTRSNSTRGEGEH